MAIKTDELQKTAAPALTDTLLMASSAAGTTRLTLAQAAAFFGAEMVKTGNPVGTALSNKAALSAQQTVEKASVSARTVELEASELPDYIAGLPRLLTEILTIKVSGTLSEPLYLPNFYGSGSIWIEGSGGCTLQKGIGISACSARITLKNLEFNGKVETSDAIVVIQTSRYVSMQYCAITGSRSANNAGEPGVWAALSSFANLAACEITNCGTAVLAYSGSILTLYDDSGDGFSGNGIGANAYRSGIILLSGQTPELLGGSTNVNAGGLIAKNGSLL